VASSCFLVAEINRDSLSVYAFDKCLDCGFDMMSLPNQIFKHQKLLYRDGDAIVVGKIFFDRDGFEDVGLFE
jgi:hypothetical protein